MKVSFPYEKESSRIFGSVKRPIAQVSFFSRRRQRWLNYTMVVDTGADYTLLPSSAASDLKVDLKRECRKLETFGVGGSEVVYLADRFPVRINNLKMEIPVGFLGRDDIPPLLGRQDCLNRLDVLFSHFTTYFSLPATLRVE